MLNAIYHHQHGVTEEESSPILEWLLYPTRREWDVIRDALAISAMGTPLRLDVRVGFPEAVSPDTLVQDS